MEKVSMSMDFNTAGLPSLYSDLARSFNGDIDTSYRNIQEHSKDGSPCTIAPHIIAYPKTIEDIKKIIARADEYRIPIAVRGFGHSATAATLVEGIVINMTKYFNHIKHVDMLGNTINVDPGVSCKKIREHLGGWGMEIPFLTEQNDDDTIGGVVATKNVSPTSFEHGSIASWVMGLSIILSNGEAHVLEDGITPSGKLLAIYQELFPLLAKETHNLRGAKPMCGEDNSGYNVWGTSVGVRQLINNIIGSQGTLAIITGIKLRIVPKRAHRVTSLVRVPSYGRLSAFVTLAKEHGADELFMYDTIIENLHKEHYEKSDSVVASSIPHTLTLVVSFSGADEKMLHEKQKRLGASLRLEEEHITTLPENNHIHLLTQSSHIDKLLRTYGGGELLPCATGSGIIVPVDHLGDALEDIENYHNEHHLVFAVTGNVGSGHLSVTTLIPPHHATYADAVTTATEACYLIAKKYKGGGGALSGDGMIGTPYLPLFFSAKTLETFKAIKTIWDPHDILNPGKKIVVDANYIKNRILP